MRRSPVSLAAACLAACLAAACLAWPAAAMAQEPAAPADEILAAPGVTVTGRLPGPRLWYVAKGDAELFVFGALNPLPEDLVWDASAVRSIIDQVDAVYGPPQVSGGVLDMARIGSVLATTMLFRRDALELPDGKRLADVAPPDLARRYAAALAKIDADTRAYEAAQRAARRGRAPPTQTEERLARAAARYERQFREAEQSGRALPYWLALSLSVKGLSSVGLTQRERTVTEEVQRLARRADVRVRPAREYGFEASDLTALLRAVRTMPMAEQFQCLEASLTVVEQHLPRLRARADAWARGDVEALRRLPAPAEDEVCSDLLFARSAPLRSLEGQRPGELDAADLYWPAIEEALSRPGARLAIVPIDAVIRRNGLMDRLREAGYEVRGP